MKNVISLEDLNSGYQRSKFEVRAMIVEVDKDVYQSDAYILQKWDKKSTSSVGGFGSGMLEKVSPSKDESIYIIKDKEYKDIPLTDNKMKSITSGLDAWTSAKASQAIDYLTEDLAEKTKDQLKDYFSKTICSVPPTNIMTIDGHDSDIPGLTDADKKELDKNIKRIMSTFSGSSGVSGGSFDITKIDKYSFKKNLMFVGGAGQGKTYNLSGWIYQKESEGEIKSVECAGHEAFEAGDMLGMMVPNNTGTLTWVDGPVTEAFRLAASGQKTVLMIDEILRIPQRELSLLIDALIPKADGMLNLRSGRLVDEKDGLGKTEHIKCSPDNLWVVAASNIGAGFAVDDMDTAFADRFRVIKVEAGVELVRNVVSKICKAKGFPDVVKKRMVELFEQYHAMKAKGNLQKTLSLRHISEVLNQAESVDEIGSLLRDLEYTVLSVNSTGKVNESELDIFNSLIAHFE